MRYVCEFDYNDRSLLRDVVTDETFDLALLETELDIGLDGGELMRCYPLSIVEPTPMTGFVRRNDRR